MKIFKFFLKFYTYIIYCAIILAFFSLLPPALAQTCGGKPSCTSTTYSESPDGFYCLHNTLNDPFCSSPGTDQVNCNVCVPQTDYNTPYSCRMNSFYGQCSSCVDDDQICSPYNYFEGNVYMDYPYQGTPFFLRCYQDVSIQWVPLQQYGCSSNVEQKFCASGCKTYCDSGTTNCGACGGGSEPTNTCGTTGGSRTCQHNQPQTCTNTNFSQGCNYTYDQCSNNYTCPSPGGAYGTKCVTHINVHVYKDYNHNGSLDTGDTGFQGVTVVDGQGHTQTTDSTGLVIFTNEDTGTYPVAITVPANWHSLGNQITQTVTLTNNNGNVSINYWLTPMYSISGESFIDANHDKNLNNGETSYGDGTVYVQQNGTTVKQVSIGSDGTYDTGVTFESGTYTVQYGATFPQGYTMTTTNSWTVVLGNPAGSPDCSVGTSPDAACGGTNNGSISGLNYGIDKPYQISGSIFNDKNKDTKDNGSDTAFTGGSTIAITGPINMSVNASGGNYSTGQVLLPGTYTVTYNTSATPLPAGYEFTTSDTFKVTIGYSPQCSVGGSPDATCGAPNNGSGANTGSVNSLNFGLTNEHVHENAVCLDIRTDNQGNGTISDQLPPPGATCGGQDGSKAIIDNGTCSTGSGIVYSCNGTFDFGLGDANANDWTAGGASQNTECYSGPGLDVVPTSYNYLMTTAKESNITPTNLDNLQNPNPNTSCTTTDCTLPADLPKGIYQVNGNLTMHAAPYTFPAPSDPSTVSYAYIILVNGDLHINANIYVPKGTVVVFSVAGNIYVDKSVGNTVTDPNNPSVNNPDLEGVYSADKSFIVQSFGSGTAICNLDGTPLDKRLVVLGVVITNAAKGGGAFTNNRDLCIYDNNCSSTQVGDGNGTDGVGGGSGEGVLLNYLLNIMADGQFLMNKNFNWQELRP